MNSTSSEGVTMISLDPVIVRDVKQEPVNWSEVIEVHIANPEIKEEFLDKFAETSEDGSSLDHIKQEPELSIISKLPPLTEDEEKLKKHLPNEPINPTIYHCYQCQESFNLREEWQDHVRKHKPTIKLQCDYCGENFKWQSTLKRHQSTMGNYKCAVCDLEFRCKYAKINHTRDVHGQDFKCPKCSFVAGDLRGLISHSHIHRNKTERYTCDKCGKDCGTQCLLLRHMNLIGLYECSMCEKTFECSYARDQHFQDIHGQDLLTSRRTHIRIAKENFTKEISGIAHPFGCGYCGKDFKNKCKLLEHQAFLECICFICNKKFKCFGAVGKHKSAHDNKLSFKCPKCPFIFYSVSELSRHCSASHQTPITSVTLPKVKRHSMVSNQAKLNENTETLNKYPVFESSEVPETETLESLETEIIGFMGQTSKSSRSRAYFARSRAIFERSQKLARKNLV